MSELNLTSDLKFTRDILTRKTVVYGGNGMGKTNVTGGVLPEELYRLNLRFTFMDPMGIGWGLQHGAKRGEKGLGILILGGPHGDIEIEPTAGAVVADLVADESISTVVDYSRTKAGKGWSKGEKIRFTADFYLRLHERQAETRRPILVIQDEASRFIPQIIPHGSPDVARCVGAIETMAEEGRNLGVGMVFVTPRSARMNKSVSELADTMIAFRTIGPNSVDAIMDWLGEHVEKERHKEIVGKLRTLPVGSALVVSPGWLQFEGVVRFRMRHTFDSSKTPEIGIDHRAPTAATKPDLEKYKERMAATIEKAKADDPGALRAEILALKRQLAAKAPAAPAKPVERIVEKEVRIKDPRPLVTEAITKRIEATACGVEKASAKLLAALAEVTTLAAKAAKAPLATGGKVSRPVYLEASDCMHPAVLLSTSRKDIERRAANTFMRALASEPRPAPAERVPHAPHDLAKGAMAILGVVAQYPQGATREQITVMTGYKKSSRDTYLQKLLSGQLVSHAGDKLIATEAGIAALGGSFSPLPTGMELREHWLMRLPRGEAAILKVIIQAYPDAIARERISEATNYLKTSRDTYLQKLAARQLIAAAGPGEVRASDNLFDAQELVR